MLDACRCSDNDTLAYHKAGWDNEPRPADGDDTKRRIPIGNAARPSLHTVHAPVVPRVTKQVDLAFTAFFRRVKAGDTPGELRVRGNGRYDCFTYPYVDAYQMNGQWRDRSTIIAHRPLADTNTTLTIRRARTGTRDAWFSVVTEPERLPERQRTVGSDGGVMHVAPLPTGETDCEPALLPHRRTGGRQRTVSLVEHCKGNAGTRPTTYGGGAYSRTHCAPSQRLRAFTQPPSRE